jgi:hypothetical protein
LKTILWIVHSKKEKRNWMTALNDSIANLVVSFPKCSGINFLNLKSNLFLAERAKYTCNFSQDLVPMVVLENSPSAPYSRSVRSNTKKLKLRSLISNSVEMTNSICM